METVLCNSCNNASSDIIFEIPDLYLNRVNKLYTFVKCRNCGLIYQNPQPTQEEIQEAYPAAYETFNVGHPRSWLEMQAHRYGIEKRCNTVVYTKRQGGKILDIGCSTGTFLDAMRTKFGWEAYGVEVNEYAAEIARERFKLEIFTGSLKRASYPSDYFDAITLWDVLEHVTDPSSTLSEVKRIMKPDGILILRVPNYDSWGARIFGQTWAGLDAPRHLYVFSRKNLITVLDKNGFSTPKLSSFSGSFPMFVISVKFLLNKYNINSACQKYLVRLINNPIMQIILIPVNYLGSLFLRGEEITAITSPN